MDQVPAGAGKPPPAGGTASVANGRSLPLARHPQAPPAGRTRLQAAPSRLHEHRFGRRGAPQEPREELRGGAAQRQHAQAPQKVSGE